jgi:hypothetical protein
MRTISGYATWVRSIQYGRTANLRAAAERRGQIPCCCGATTENPPTTVIHDWTPKGLCKVP